MAFVQPSALLKSRLDRFSRMLTGVEKGDVRSLHRARVASRRLREIVPVLKLDADTTRKLNRRLRKVTVRLGTVRELDVLLLLIDELQESRPVHQNALRRVRVDAEKAHEAARARLLDHLPLHEMRRIVRKLERALDEVRHRESRGRRGLPADARAAMWAMDARVANRAARLASAIENAGAVYLPERLHGVRIAAKKLRYALELSSESRAEKTNPPLRMLKRMQELLGRMHDLQVLIDRVRDVQASLTPPNVGMWRELDELVVALDDMCRRLHARYVRERDGIEALAASLSARTRSAAARSERRAM